MGRGFFERRKESEKSPENEISLFQRMRWLILVLFSSGICLSGVGYYFEIDWMKYVSILLCSFLFTACAVIVASEEANK